MIAHEIALMNRAARRWPSSGARVEYEEAQGADGPAELGGRDVADREDDLLAKARALGDERASVVLESLAMAEQRADVVRLYEGALRALDTKAQIYLAFVTLSLAPVFTRLATSGAGWPVRVGAAALVAATVLAFIVCLFPRRGARSTQMLFDLSKTEAELRRYAARDEFEIDYADTIGTLHGIYVVKTRALRVGTVLVALYALAAAAALALA